MKTSRRGFFSFVALGAGAGIIVSPRRKFWNRVKFVAGSKAGVFTARKYRIFGHMPGDHIQDIMYVEKEFAPICIFVGDGIEVTFDYHRGDGVRTMNKPIVPIRFELVGESYGKPCGLVVKSVIGPWKPGQAHLVRFDFDGNTYPVTQTAYVPYKQLRAIVAKNRV